jgi:hypothetical protein
VKPLLLLLLRQRRLCNPPTKCVEHSSAAVRSCSSIRRCTAICACMLTAIDEL